MLDAVTLDEMPQWVLCEVKYGTTIVRRFRVDTYGYSLYKGCLPERLLRAKEYIVIKIIRRVKVE